jgi:hypothetical protein
MNIQIGARFIDFFGGGSNLIKSIPTFDMVLTKELTPTLTFVPTQVV